MKLFYPTSCLAAAAALCVGVPASAVHVGTITDTTPGSATNDGTIGGGEYAGFSNGINTGFGDVIGASSELHLDSDTSGSLHLGIRSVGAFNDNAVIYIDSVAGGLADTTTIEDIGDGGRAAISGDALDGVSGESEIFFAPGTTEGSTFLADYAIAIDGGFAGLFAINGDGTLTFVASGDMNVSGSDREFDFTLGDIGLAVGDSFDYVGTYLNSGNAFRSNEFQGVVNQSPAFDSNIGQNNVVLADGDYRTFVSVPEPASLALVGLGGLMMIGRRRA